MKGRRIKAGWNADEVSFTHDELERGGWMGDVGVGRRNPRLGTDKHRKEGGERGSSPGQRPAPGDGFPRGRR